MGAMKEQEADLPSEEELEEELPEELELAPSAEDILAAAKDAGAEKESGKYISQEREYELISRYRKNGDEKALLELLKAHERYCHKQTRFFSRKVQHLDYDDLFQEARMGLIKGIERYDLQSGFRLLTYATWWIRQTMSRTIADTDKTIRVPVHTQELAEKIFYTKREFKNENGRDPTLEELSEKLEKPIRAIRNAAESYKTMASLDAPLKAGEDDSVTLAGILDSGINIEDEVITRYSTQKYVDSLFANTTLSDKERAVIEARYLSDPDGEMLTLEEVGEQFGVTRERIRQIEAKALDKIYRTARRIGRGKDMDGNELPDVRSREFFNRGAGGGPKVILEAQREHSPNANVQKTKANIKPKSTKREDERKTLEEDLTIILDKECKLRRVNGLAVCPAGLIKVFGSKYAAWARDNGEPVAVLDRSNLFLGAFIPAKMLPEVSDSHKASSLDMADFKSGFSAAKEQIADGKILMLQSKEGDLAAFVPEDVYAEVKKKTFITKQELEQKQVEDELEEDIGDTETLTDILTDEESILDALKEKVQAPIILPPNPAYKPASEVGGRIVKPNTLYISHDTIPFEEVKDIVNEEMVVRQYIYDANSMTKAWDLSKAATFLETALDQYPDNANLLSKYADTLSKIQYEDDRDYGDNTDYTDQIYDAFEKALEIDPANRRALDGFGAFLALEGEIQRAEQMFIGCIHYQGYSEFILQRLADLYIKDYEDEKALGCLGRIYDLQGEEVDNNAQLIAKLEKVEAKLGYQYNPAIHWEKLYKYIEKYKADNFEPIVLQNEEEYLLQEKRYSDSADYEQACALLKKGIERFPDSADIHYRYGFLLWKSHSASGEEGVSQETADIYARAYELNPEDPVGLTHYGDFLKDASDFAKAEEVLTKRISLHGADWQTLYNLGRVYYKQGEPEKALGCLGRAREINRNKHLQGKIQIIEKELWTQYSRQIHWNNNAEEHIKAYALKNFGVDIGIAPEEPAIPTETETAEIEVAPVSEKANSEVSNNALTHDAIWNAIDRLAEQFGYSASGLAKKAGMDATSFNKSKRFDSVGKPRWPSTESISRILAATGASMAAFMALTQAIQNDAAPKFSSANSEEITNDNPVEPRLESKEFQTASMGFVSANGTQYLDQVAADNEPLILVDKQGNHHAVLIPVEMAKTLVSDHHLSRADIKLTKFRVGFKAFRENMTEDRVYFVTTKDEIAGACILPSLLSKVGFKPKSVETEEVRKSVDKNREIETIHMKLLPESGGRYINEVAEKEKPILILDSDQQRKAMIIPIKVAHRLVREKNLMTGEVNVTDLRARFQDFREKIEAGKIYFIRSRDNYVGACIPPDLVPEVERSMWLQAPPEPKIQKPIKRNPPADFLHTKDGFPTCKAGYVAPNYAALIEWMNENKIPLLVEDREGICGIFSPVPAAASLSIEHKISIVHKPKSALSSSFKEIREVAENDSVVFLQDGGKNLFAYLSSKWVDKITKTEVHIEPVKKVERPGLPDSEGTTDANQLDTENEEIIEEVERRNSGVSITEEPEEPIKNESEQDDLPSQAQLYNPDGNIYEMHFMGFIPTEGRKYMAQIAATNEPIVLIDNNREPQGVLLPIQKAHELADKHAIEKKLVRIRSFCEGFRDFRKKTTDHNIYFVTSRDEVIGAFATPKLLSSIDINLIIPDDDLSIRRQNPVFKGKKIPPLSFRVTEDEYFRIKASANQHGYKQTSGFIRDMLFGNRNDLTMVLKANMSVYAGENPAQSISFRLTEDEHDMLRANMAQEKIDQMGVYVRRKLFGDTEDLRFAGSAIDLRPENNFDRLPDNKPEKMIRASSVFDRIQKPQQKADKVSDTFNIQSPQNTAETLKTLKKAISHAFSGNGDATVKAASTSFIITTDPDLLEFLSDFATDNSEDVENGAPIHSSLFPAHNTGTFNDVVKMAYAFSLACQNKNCLLEQSNGQTIAFIANRQPLEAYEITRNIFAQQKHE